MKALSAFLVLTGLLLNTSLAAEMDLPEPLKPWVPWVLHGQENRVDCPFSYQSYEQSQCTWFETLHLNIAKNNVRFRFAASVLAESRLPLPGGERSWPRGVTINGKPGVVVARGNNPEILLEPGTYQIEGFADLAREKDSFRVPQAFGLVDLTIDGAPHQVTRRNGDKIWFGSPQVTGASSTQENRVSARVFRLLSDDVPMQMETRIELTVSGASREMAMSPALLPGFIETRLNSQLPAKLEPDGTLRAQVRPGTWQISVTSRSTNPTQMSFDRPTISGDWPDQEIWSFQQAPAIRNLKVISAAPADPSQTGVPPAWRRFPAFVMGKGSTLSLEELSRGDQKPADDRLTIQREIWMDFDGGGLTARDTISGEINAVDRLNAASGDALGQVEVNGEPSLITLDSDGKTGIQVNSGPLEVTSVSRISSPRSFSTSGWDHDFQNVQSVVHLPPGWKVISASGVDRAYPTWISKWSLMDVFIVLLIAGAFAKLFSMPVGALALVTLAISYQAPGSPKLVWIGLAMTIALTQHLPVGKVRSAALVARNFFALGLVVMCLPFFAQLLQQALYPQLERHSAHANTYSAGMPRSVMPQPAAEMAMDMVVSAPGKLSRDAYAGSAPDRVRKEIAPTLDSNVQTGPGVPSWRWNTLNLTASGPVAASEHVTLLLSNPTLTRLGQVVQLLLILLLAAAVMLKGFRADGKWILRTAAPFMFAALTLSSTSTPSMASDIPSEKMLSELRERLLAPPACLPECASFPTAVVRLDKQQLQIGIEVLASENVTVPLPAQHQSWTPEVVQLDGVKQQTTFTADGSLLISIPPGKHLISLTGPASLDVLSLRFPLKPHHISVQAEGWNVVGIEGNSLKGDDLTLSRIVEKALTESPSSQLKHPSPPAFAKVERTLVLGIKWSIYTNVQRVSPPANDPVVVAFDIPLIEGESPLTEGLNIHDGQAKVVMAPGSNSVRWESALKPSDRIQLLAADAGPWSETWNLQVDPRWKIEATGIAPIKNPNSSQITTWKPRPGESVSLEVTEPKAAPGETLTIDDVSIRTQPGARMTEVDVAIDLRSSIGDALAMRLPPDSSLTDLTVRGDKHAFNPDEPEFSIPVVPGAQHIEFSFRTSNGFGVLTKTESIDTDHDISNAEISMQVPRDRWILFTFGPLMGPAVLFWGVLAVALGAALLIERFLAHPVMRTKDWVLLAIGLTGAGTAWAGLLALAWFTALKFRSGIDPEKTQHFNVMQIGLALLTVVFVINVGASVPMGLLGSPDMHIAGNGSTSAFLQWYQPSVQAGLMPQGGIVSLPIWVYRIAMLAWSLWLATALIRWLQWGWQSYSTDGVWIKKTTVKTNGPVAEKAPTKGSPDQSSKDS